ncbi:hypothetical protein LSTR_LSTR010175 [Laodelphax striatellus]|uniref:Uncharacterized protein n=1 Tax=Laodelphax striatellus TaxID=195883 RepID=A0A482XL85_LAOST|nr:hypothetical protein LSTR_LSTR010175 [Laodelphax striatellus]
MSGTIAVGKRYVPSFLTKEHSDGREVIYALDVERVHKFSILKQLELETGKPLNRDKLTIIKVGKPAELPRENNQIKVTSHLSVECEWEEEDKATFRSKYIPVLYVSSSRDGSEAGGVQQQADLTTLFDRFFRLFEWEVWTCKDQAEGFQFERIMTIKVSLMAQAVLDINYELQSKFVYKTVIGQTGAILKMGNRYDVNLDIANAFGENLLTCVKDFNMGQNAGNDYNMKVKIGTEEQSLFKFTTIDEQKINDLFENRKATYWTCATKDKVKVL